MFVKSQRSAARMAVRFSQYSSHINVLAELVIANQWFCISRFAPSSDNMNTLEVLLDFPKKVPFLKAKDLRF